MRRARQEVQALLNSGYSVIVITDLKYRRFLHSINKIKGKLFIKPIKLLYIYRFRKISSELSFSFQTYYALKQIHKNKSIDLIVAHAATNCYAVAKFAIKYKIPAVWVIQDLIKDRIATGNPYNWWETQLYKHANRYAISKMPYLLPVSKYSKKLVLLDGAKPKNTFIKYNTVNTALFHPDENIKKDIDILFIGRLSVEKGVDILIESIKYLSEKKRILIVGDGILRSKLEQQAMRSPHEIKFTGWVEHNILPEFILRAKLVVTPSRSECHAAVPLEAMSCAVPVIASKVAGMEDTIDNNKNGWLLEKNDAKTLGALLNQVLFDEKEIIKVSKKALKKSEYFSEKRFNIEIVKFYEELIKKFH